MFEIVLNRKKKQNNYKILVISEDMFVLYTIESFYFRHMFK